MALETALFTPHLHSQRSRLSPINLITFTDTSPQTAAIIIGTRLLSPCMYEMVVALENDHSSMAYAELAVQVRGII